MPDNKYGKKAFKYSGLLRSFFAWPLYIGAVLIIICAIMFCVNVTAATVVSIFMVIYLMACGLMYFYMRPRIMLGIVEFASNYSQVQKQLLYNLSVPYCLLDNNGNVMWTNKAMQDCLGIKRDFRKNINTVIPEVTPSIFPDSEIGFKEIRLTFQDRDYKAELKNIDADSIAEGVDIIEKSMDSSMYVMYLFDETDINTYIQKLKDERFVVGLVYIDNYEEALDSTDDVRRSLLAGLIDKRVNKYFSPGSAIVRKLEKDKFIVVFRYNFLEKLMQDRFSLLEEIKSIKIGNEMTLTLSMGIGTGSAEYSKNYDVAKAAMDLALGRGGDQAVVKDGEKILYYGGKSQQMEKNTRVKVRVKAHALRQILDNNSNVLVMGHTLADIDAFGSALGIYVIAKKLGKEAHIVLGEVTSSVRPFVNRFIGKEEYPDDMFIKPDDAPSKINASTVVIVVDVNSAFAANLALLMMNRSCTPPPTGPFSSCRETLNTSLRPSTAVSSLSQVTVMPTGVGALCSSSSRVPTVPQPSSSAAATLIQQVFSASATSAGVANTSSVPLPMVFAVFSEVTATLCSPRIPASNIKIHPFQMPEGENLEIHC